MYKTLRVLLELFATIDDVFTERDALDPRQRQASLGRIYRAWRTAELALRGEKTEPSPRVGWVTIYALVDPNTEEVRYVGKTQASVVRRLSDHISGARRNKQDYKSRWIRTLLRRGQSPLLVTIDEVRADHWEELEKFWIESYRQQGSPLTNAHEGGGSGPLSEATKERLRLSHMGKTLTMEHRMAISRSLRGNRRAEGAQNNPRG
jgi:hypothetical protein